MHKPRTRALIHNYILRVFLTGAALCLTVPSQGEQTHGEQIHGENAEDEFFIDESFILLRVKNRQDSFYRVMMDENETPYLDVGSIFEWMELPFECNFDEKQCQATMTPGGEIYWVNAQQKTFGDSKSGDTKELPPNSLFLKEETLWLRWDIWRQWMPLYISWTLNSYAINLLPDFQSLAERKRIRQLNRDKFWRKQREKETLQSLPAISPEKENLIETRFQIGIARPAKGKVNTQATHSESLDVLNGNLQLTGALSEASSAGDLVSQWTYQQKLQPSYHLLELGQTQFQSTLLIPSVGAKTGFRLDKRERIQGMGAFEYEGNTIPGTEIDVRIGGFLSETLIADENGNFEISKRFVGSGDRVEIAFFLPNGFEEETIIQIAQGSALLLRPKEWDSRLFLGSTATGQFNHLEFRYGLIENLSAGASIYQLPENIAGNSVQTGYNLNWRAHDNLNIEFEGFGSNSYTTQVNAVLPYGQSLQFTYGKISESSTLNNTPLFTISDLDYTKLLHNIQIARWQVLTELTKTPRDFNTEIHLNHRFNRDLSFTSSFEGQKPKDLGLQVTKSLNLAYQINYSSETTLSRIIDANNNGIWDFEFKFEGDSNNPWTKKKTFLPWQFFLTLSVPDQGKSKSDASVRFFLSPNASTILSANNNGIGLQFLWQEGIISKPTDKKYRPSFSRKPYDNFARGTLSGHVFSPPSPGEAPEPLSGVTVIADRSRAETDDNGFYHIGGLPTYKKLAVRVDHRSLDASMAAKKEVVMAQFRPTSRINYDPELTWTAGIDGVLYTDRVITRGLIVQVTSLTTGKVAGTGNVESDGFFMVEGLTPNRYQLSLLGSDDPPPPHEFTVPEDTDWISEIRFEWLSDGQKRKNQGVPAAQADNPEMEPVSEFTSGSQSTNSIEGSSNRIESADDTERAEVIERPEGVITSDPANSIVTTEITESVELSTSAKGTVTAEIAEDTKSVENDTETKKIKNDHDIKELKDLEHLDYIEYFDYIRKILSE